MPPERNELGTVKVSRFWTRSSRFSREKSRKKKVKKVSRIIYKTVQKYRQFFIMLRVQLCSSYPLANSIPNVHSSIRQHSNYFYSKSHAKRAISRVTHTHTHTHIHTQSKTNWSITLTNKNQKDCQTRTRSPLAKISEIRRKDSRNTRRMVVNQRCPQQQQEGGWGGGDERTKGGKCN